MDLAYTGILNLIAFILFKKDKTVKDEGLEEEYDSDDDKYEMLRRKRAIEELAATLETGNEQQKSHTQTIDLVIKLEEWDKDKEYDRLGLQEEYTEFLGNRVVCHSIPIRPGRSLAVIVESAAVNHRQKKMGYNAAQELYNRVQKSLAKKKEEQKK